MREHQIVVNLKAQQFEQLQKLARERGFKSVSAYVKQKVLELAMGIDSDGPSGQASNDQVSLAAAPVLGDLDRIHNELKSFLDELSGPTELPSSAIGSLAGNLASGLSGTADGTAVGYGFGAAPGGAQANSATSSSGSSSSRESGNNFGVAAPDDDFDWAPSGGSGYSTAAYTNAIGPGGSNIAASSLDIGSAAGDFQEDPEAALPQVLPSSNLGGFGYGLGKYSSFGGASSSARFSTPFNAGDRLSGYRDIMDDMEELADRAFAISPRLGALDENVEEEPEDSGRGRRKRVDAADESAAASPASSFGAELDGATELDEQGAAELEASAYAESSEDYDSGYDYAEDDLKLDLELGTLAPAAPVLPSFVEPIALDKLLTPEQLEAEDVQEKLNVKEGKKAQAEAKMRADLADIAPVTDFSPEASSEASSDQPDEEKLPEKPLPRRRSNKLFDAPMLPPPDEIDETIERKPTFVPPPAPLPPRVSQTNIPAMTAEEAAALEKAAAQVAAAAIEDDLLSELLDGNLTHQRDESAPNPFAVSLSFELEATAVATNDVAGPVGILADQLASMEEQTPLGQMAMEAEAALHSASEAAGAGASSGASTKDETSSSSGSSASSVAGSATSAVTSAVPADSISTDSGEESLNPSTFSGTPPPKRRRT
ncbi:MAG: hypothetical protein WCT03_10985 [Candidatus Obscuribacterales bacterium]|jgi:hypothetical protein